MVPFSSLTLTLTLTPTRSPTTFPTIIILTLHFLNLFFILFFLLGVGREIKMSCNGCRILRRGCGEDCILRPCLEWIQRPEAQANATLFVSKFFGRSDLMAFIAAVPENRRPALFQSLLFEACGRAVNPVDGAVGLLSTGNWHICQSAVEAVLAGESLRPISVDFHRPIASGFFRTESEPKPGMTSSGSGLCEISPEFGRRGNGVKRVGSKEPKLLNLF